MPLFLKWSSFTKNNVSTEPDSFGVYELADGSGNVLYIGEGRLRPRLLSHFITGRSPIPGTAKYRAEITGVKERAQQRERAEIRSFTRSYGDCPKFNDRLG